MQTIEKILLNYDPEEKNILPALKEASASLGFISLSDGQKIARYFSVSSSKIFETASFYDLVKTEKQSPLVIRICSGTHCAVGGSSGVVKGIENLFHIKSQDKFNPRVKLEIISCLGRCGEGPILIVNEKVYEKVTASSVHKILEGWL